MLKFKLALKKPRKVIKKERRDLRLAIEYKEIKAAQWYEKQTTYKAHRKNSQTHRKYKKIHGEWRKRWSEACKKAFPQEEKERKYKAWQEKLKLNHLKQTGQI